MKLQKLLLSVVAGCLLIGAAGEAWAIDCDGIIDDSVVQDVTVGPGASCIVTESSVRGDIRATGAGVVVLSGNDVGGKVLIEDSAVVSVLNNDLWGNGFLIVRRSDLVAVIGNNVERRFIRITGNIEAVVKKNSAAQGLICRDNTVLNAAFNSISCGD